MTHKLKLTVLVRNFQTRVLGRIKAHKKVTLFMHPFFSNGIGATWKQFSFLLWMSSQKWSLANSLSWKKNLHSTVDGPVIGIDLGTTYSVVAFYDAKNQKAEVIANELGSTITPSVVSYTDKGERIIGEAAKSNAPVNPKNTFYDAKRLIGRRFGEVLQKDAKLLSYDIVNKEGRVYIKVQKTPKDEVELQTPEQISAVVLQKMKAIAERYLNQTVKYAVVTVPAYFNDQQRQATKDAGKIAGLEVLRMVNEPTAAAMAFGLHKKSEQNILVFDLGGGTFDVSLLTIERGVFEVIATAGDTHLGGEDFDVRVVDHFAAEIKKKHNKDVRADKKAFQKLKLACEKAKRELSAKTETLVEVDSLFEGIDFSEKLTRAAFEKINMDLFKATLKPVEQVLKDAGLQKTDVDEVVLVGGSTRIPKVQELLSQYFNGKKLNKEVNPDEAVGVGAAVQAAVLAATMTQEVILIDVTPLSLGIETEGGIMATIIPRNTRIPANKADTFTTTEDYQDRLHIPIYEGERKLTKYNRLLGDLQLTNIPPAPRGVPQIKVQFELNADGILKVTALDQGTGNKKEVTIQKGQLTPEEIEKMTKEAEKNAAEDKEAAEAIELRRKLEDYIDEVLGAQVLGNRNVANRIKAKDLQRVIQILKEKKKWVAKNTDVSKSQYQLQLKSLRKVVDPVLAQAYGNNTPASLDEDDDDAPISGSTDDVSVSSDDKPISDDNKPISEIEVKSEDKKKDEL